jgi:hypothetical protein
MNKLVPLALVLGVVACDTEPPLPEGYGAIQLAITASDPHDVAQFEFRVIAAGSGDCNSGTVIESSTIPLNTSLMIADDIFVLPADNYLVCAMPQQTGGTPSAECADASANATVVDSQSSSVMLSSNCTGGGNGAIDVTVTLEDFPLITNIDVQPSQYIEACQFATLAATLDDPGADGFNSILWSVETFPVGAVTNLGSADQLSTTFFTDTTGEYELKLTVDDQIAGLQSLTFPMHSLACATSRATQWLAGATGGAGSIDSVFDVAASGDDTVAVGYFVGSIDFGLGVLGAAVGSNTFVLKLDANGSPLWSHDFGATGSRGDRVGVDASGDVFMLGYTGNTGVADFPGGVCPVLGQGGYLAKLSGTTGNCIWAVGLAPTIYQFSDLVVDSGGDVVAAYVEAGDITVQKHNGLTGAQLWSGVIDDGGGSGQLILRGMSVSPVDNAVAVAGTTDQTSLTLPGGATVPVVQDSSMEGFVAQLDAGTGDMTWIQQAPGAGSTPVWAVATTANGDVVAAWDASGDADFGGGTITPGGVAVVSYDAAGLYQSAHVFPDSAALQVKAIEASAGGQLRLLANFTGAADLGNGTIAAVGFDYLVFSMFQTSGAVAWTAQGTPRTGQRSGLAVAPDGATIVGGSYNAAFTFGAASLPFFGGSSDPFIAKLAP